MKCIFMRGVRLENAAQFFFECLFSQMIFSSIVFQMFSKNQVQLVQSARSLTSHHRRALLHGRRKYDEYNYFKPSLLPTDHFQYSLPRLPIPKLELTCQRYLTALEPILNNDTKAFEQTKQLVADFQKGDGQRLDAQLRQKNTANLHTSYISKPWFDMYLKSRLPLILNFNFFLVFADDPQQPKPAARLTNYIVSSVRFMNSLRANWLDPEVFHLNPKKSNTDRFRRYLRFVPKSVSFYGAVLQKAYPLDMSQYDRLFSSTRVPKIGCDQLISHHELIRHIIVIKRGHYYKVNVLNEDGQLYSAEKIGATMKFLSEDLNEKENEFPLGYFTADNRDRWANVREQMEKLSEENRRVFKEIDSSLMVICLGKNSPFDRRFVRHWRF